MKHMLPVLRFSLSGMKVRDGRRVIVLGPVGSRPTYLHGSPEQCNEIKEASMLPQSTACGSEASTHGAPHLLDGAEGPWCL